MTREFRFVYELGGTRGALFISTLTESGARQIFAKHFPTARVIRVSVEPGERGAD